MKHIYSLLFVILFASCSIQQYTVMTTTIKDIAYEEVSGELHQVIILSNGHTVIFDRTVLSETAIGKQYSYLAPVPLNSSGVYLLSETKNFAKCEVSDIEYYDKKNKIITVNIYYDDGTIIDTTYLISNEMADDVELTNISEEMLNKIIDYNK